MTSLFFKTLLSLNLKRFKLTMIISFVYSIFKQVSASVFSEQFVHSYDSFPRSSSGFKKLAKHCSKEFPSHCRLTQLCCSSVIVLTFAFYTYSMPHLFKIEL